MRDEVVMIGEHGPRFQLPAKFVRKLDQATMEDTQSTRGPEMVRPPICARRNEVGSAVGELM